MRPLGPREPLTLAWTGASGMQYGLRLLECLLQAGRIVYLLVSKPAQLVLATETDLNLSARPAQLRTQLCERFGVPSAQLMVFGPEEWTAPVASGSAVVGAMVVCPCTMATIAALAAGASDTLITRAGDVMIKERRQLIVVPRETPLSLIHLRNLTQLAEAGVTVLPANPGFYHRPQQVGELVDFIVARILDHLGVSHALLPRWGQDPEQPA
jgi:4-hydroxy-3-polyprenylbenzoate decarboxylase